MMFILLLIHFSYINTRSRAGGLWMLVDLGRWYRPGDLGRLSWFSTGSAPVNQGLPRMWFQHCQTPSNSRELAIQICVRDLPICACWQLVQMKKTKNEKLLWDKDLTHWLSFSSQYFKVFCSVFSFVLEIAELQTGYSCWWCSQQSKTDLINIFWAFGLNFHMLFHTFLKWFCAF